MLKIIVLLTASIFMYSAHGQNTFQTIIKVSQTKEPLPAVSIFLQPANTGTASDSTGFAILSNIPAGRQVIVFTHSGYKEVTKRFTFPLPNADTIEILMETSDEELNEVIVQSTRTSRTITNTPTRIETIDGEELDEKNNMRPANVSMLLHESTGLQVQQTSATSGNASIRVQGLDGRYTQLLKDGYPNFGNFASGLSILKFHHLTLSKLKL
ncbi:MAG: carboxypeptidase-like regulatory domain-containing protein [Ferruginibacter sp.]